jgi:hypothetical protein
LREDEILLRGDRTVVTDQIHSEISSGQGEKLTALTKRVPRYRRNRPATLGRLLRWVLHGVLDPDGNRIYLEAVRTPGGWVSTPGAMSRFFSALTPALANQPVAPAPKARSPQKRQAQSERAAKKLADMGI